MDSKNNPRKRQEEVPKNRPPSSKKPRRRRNNNKSGGGNNSNSSSSNNNADNASNSTNNVAGAGKNLHQFSKVTFASNEHISANSKRALTEVMQYEYMSKVQEATLPSILEGKDVVAKAKTGSGKTTGKQASRNEIQNISTI